MWIRKSIRQRGGIRGEERSARGGENRFECGITPFAAMDGSDCRTTRVASIVEW